MSEKLKPCPFCGGDKIEIASEDGATKAFYRAYCEACSSAGSFARSRAAAIRAWNDRPGNTINEQIGCLVDIRRIVGDPEGRLMQDELVMKIAGIMERRADAALGRAVRRFSEGMALFKQNPEWAFRQNYSGDIIRLDTPEAVLQAAGLMEVKE